MSIGKRIKNRRKELKMSAEELGAKLGKDRSTIYRYENGDIEKLSVDMLEPIAKALNTSQAWLMGWQEQEKANNEIVSIVGRLRTDSEFLEAVQLLNLLEKEKFDSVKQMLILLK